MIARGTMTRTKARIAGEAGEAGEADTGFLVQVMVVCVLVSVTAVILGWVQSVKDARSGMYDNEIAATDGHSLPGYSVRYFPGICGSNECLRR